MTIRHIQIFAAICKTGSMTAAARDLGMSQPAVSLAVRDMERFYGTQLFERLNRQMTLTQVGKRVHGYAMLVLDSFSRLEGVNRGDEAHALTIAATPLAGECLLPGAVGAHTAKGGEGGVRVRVLQGRALEQAVLSGEADFALSEEAVPQRELCAVPVVHSELAAVCAKGHALSREGLCEIHALTRYPLLTAAPDSAPRRLLDTALQQCALAAEPLWTSDSPGALMAAAEAGLGVAVLPGLYARARAQGRDVRVLPLSGMTGDVCFSVITHRRRSLSPASRRFIDRFGDDMARRVAAALSSPPPGD